MLDQVKADILQNKKIPYINQKGTTPVTLMTKCMKSLAVASKIHGTTMVKVGILRLLNTWLYASPSSVIAFLSSSTNVPFVNNQYFLERFLINLIFFFLKKRL